MTARKIDKIISLDDHGRSVKYGQPRAKSPLDSIECRNDDCQLQAAAIFINKLFSELQTCFPAWRQTFTSKADMDAAKRTWARGLIEAKITSYKQIQWGLLKARRSESPFWPSLGQFIAWCQPDPADYGLPDTRKAYLEACRNAYRLAEMTNDEWSHPAVYIALKNTGVFDIRNRSEVEIWPIFKRNYEIAVRRAFNGEDLKKEIPKALPSQVESRPVSPEVALENIKRLKKMFKGG